LCFLRLKNYVEKNTFSFCNYSLSWNRLFK